MATLTPLVCKCRTFDIPDGCGLYEDGFIHTVDCCPDIRLRELLPPSAVARWTNTYAEGIESQSEVRELTRIENWPDFYAGQVYAAKQIAAVLRTSVGEEGGNDAK